MKRESGDRPDANLGFIQLRWESWRAFLSVRISDLYMKAAFEFFPLRWRHIFQPEAQLCRRRTGKR